jgi:AraC-like DNA-binding protein
VDDRIITYADLLQKRDIRFPFPVRQIGYLRSHGHEELHQRYNYVEFCFRLRSEGETEAVDYLDGKKFVYTFPHLFIKMPDRQHTFTIHSHRHALYLQYPAHLIPEFIANGFEMELPGMNFELTDEISKLIRELREQLPHAHQHGMAERIDINAYKLISLVLLQRENNNQESYNRIRNMAAYINSHLECELNFDDLCEQFSISRRSLFRDWRKFYPESPQAYVIRLRMGKAAQLLANRSLRIQEIGEMVGYPNTAYFVQAFRKFHGCTPGEYRR